MINKVSLKREMHFEEKKITKCVWKNFFDKSFKAHGKKFLINGNKIWPVVFLKTTRSFHLGVDSVEVLLKLDI